MKLTYSTFSVFLGALSVLTLSACSPSSRSLKKVDYCETKLDPVRMSGKDIAEKVVLKPGDEVPLEVGNYKYQGAQIYYNDPVKKIRALFTETVNADGTTSSKVSCIGGSGVNLKMQPVTFSIPITTSVVIDDVTGSTVEEKTFSFDFRRKPYEKWMDFDFNSKKAESKSGTFRGRYEEYPVSEQIFASLKKPNLYQYRVRLEAPNEEGPKDSVIKVQVLVSFKRVPVETVP